MQARLSRRSRESRTSVGEGAGLSGGILKNANDCDRVRLQIINNDARSDFVVISRKRAKEVAAEMNRHQAIEWERQLSEQTAARLELFSRRKKIEVGL